MQSTVAMPEMLDTLRIECVWMAQKGTQREPRTPDTLEPKSPEADDQSAESSEVDSVVTATAVPPPPPVAADTMRRKRRSGASARKFEMSTAKWRFEHQGICSCDQKHNEYHTTPPASFSDQSVKVPYICLPSVATGGDASMLNTILDATPKPKGRTSFSSVHVIAPPESLSATCAQPLVRFLESSALDAGVQICVHRLSELACASDCSALLEYNAIFELASSLILSRADRASLLVFVGWEDTAKDAYAAFIGMLPFRGISTALLTQRSEHGDLLRHQTTSGVFQVDGRDAGRMGMFPISAVFGELSSQTATASVRAWKPVNLSKTGLTNEPSAEQLPFKIGGLELPMVTHNAPYAEALDALASAVSAHFEGGVGYYPIVSCGETCDALGYGQDLLERLSKPGLYFSHRSGETFKRYDNYGSDELFQGIADARAEGRVPVILAVGGGVNGNSIGLVAAITGSDFIEVPTTPMHYNDATTSAKKAFSLVVEDRILSKNILGAFYLPKLVFCANEMLLTSSSASIHATVGESTKTMNMLGQASSKTGAGDYHNILGACEFASDTTRIVRTVAGFDRLVAFIQSPVVVASKAQALSLGRRIAALQKDCSAEASKEHEALKERRRIVMDQLRGLFHALESEDKVSIRDFLTVVNREIVAAKAMFLAYSDPFEKYRALLFEYAHTLGHGVEAFANGLYRRCLAKGIDVPEAALRLHGQCIGMAVLWAGQMSCDLGLLEGQGLQLHQSLVYLFNRHGGFSFKPLRELCNAAGIEKDEFCEGVLSVVRRDNKRGYVKTADPVKTVDQLVTGRPGQMVRSQDKDAELRYLVEVDEDWQRKVLCQAFDCEFDKVADLDCGQVKFVCSGQGLRTASEDVAAVIYAELVTMYRTSDAS